MEKKREFLGSDILRYPKPKNDCQKVINFCDKEGIKLHQVSEHQFIVPLKDVPVVKAKFERLRKNKQNEKTE